MPVQEVNEVRGKADRLEARINTELKALCQRAAAIQGRTLTDFVVHSSVEAARRTIREHEYLEMSRRDRLAFVKAVLDPPAPNRLLVQAAKRYKRMRQP